MNVNGNSSWRVWVSVNGDINKVEKKVCPLTISTSEMTEREGGRVH